MPAVVLLLVGGFFALLVWGLGVAGSGRSFVSKIAAGDRPTAPSFSLPVIWPSMETWPKALSRAVGSGALGVSDLRGRPVVLNFWASWCLPCRDEAPLLTAAASDYQALGLQVIGVVYQDSAENARAFMARYGRTYPGLLDPDGRTALDYGVFGIPETFFIDRGGVIVSKQTGPLDAASLRRQIEAIVP